jgi:hypothetical protein
VNQEYIPVHPFACESELLKDINWLPEKCTSVDAYWKMKNDVSFLQVMTKDVSDNKQVGIYIRWDKTKKQYLNIVAIIDESVVTRDIFEKIMCNVIHLGIHPSEKNRKRYGCKLQYKI